MDNIIEINSISKFYNDFKALDNITLSIPKGKIVGLLGPNGSGKTTLIKILSCLLKQYEGEIKINGFDLGIDTKKIVSYLPDRNVLPLKMKISEIVNYFNDFFEDFDQDKALNLLKQLDIDVNKKFKQLSKGMKEKVQLVLVLSRKAKIYIFDEPIAGVDPAARDVIFDLILKGKKNDTLGMDSCCGCFVPACRKCCFFVLIFKKSKQKQKQRSKDIRKCLCRGENS